MPVKPGRYIMTRYQWGQGYCVDCGTKTSLQYWGCLLELKDIFSVCPTSVWDCLKKMH